jgi:MFS family permease
VLIELIFVAGPLLTALLAALVDPAAALILSPVLLLVGLAGFLVQPPVRSWVVTEGAEHHGVWGALRSPGIRTLVLCTAPMGFCFGAMEVTLPAFSEAHGSPGLAGVLVATWSAGSAAGGLLYGARHWSGPPGRRYARLAALLPLGYLPLAAAPSLAAMIPLALLAGLCIAPTLTAGNQIAGDVAPPGAETEGYTWPITALVVGLAIGNWSAGAIVEAADWRTAFLVSAGGAGVSALLAATRWRTLQRVPLGAPRQAAA